MFACTPSLSKKTALLFAAGVTSACLALGAQAAGATYSRYGGIINHAASDKTVTIDADTKYVNVTDGETVKFVEGSDQFTWTFNTLRGAGEMPLSAIAPAGFNGRKVEVYVASNPIYNN